MGKKDLAEELIRRVVAAAEPMLAQRGVVSVVEVWRAMGWLDPSTLARWEEGRLASLAEGMQVGLDRLLYTAACVREWAKDKGATPVEAAYVAKTPARTPLVFGANGASELDALCRTHWISAAVSAKKRAQLEQEANEGPELVVYEPLDSDWECQRCGGSGGYLVKEGGGASCLDCAGLGELVFLPPRDAKLTRRAKERSAVYAVVVRFSRTRKRYERQGLLVQPAALESARAEIAAEKPAGKKSGQVK